MVDVCVCVCYGCVPVWGAWNWGNRGTLGHAPTSVRVVGRRSRARIRLDVVWCRTIALHLSFRVCVRARGVTRGVVCVVGADVIADAFALDGICATRRVRVAQP